MKALPFGILFFLLLMPGLITAGNVEDIAALLKQGNARGLAQTFSGNTELIINNHEDMVSPVEAEAALTRFFKQNKPLGASILHKVSSSQHYALGVIILTTRRGIFRIAITLKRSQAAFKVIEFRMEPRKRR